MFRHSKSIYTSTDGLFLASAGNDLQLSQVVLLISVSSAAKIIEFVSVTTIAPDNMKQKITGVATFPVNSATFTNNSHYFNWLQQRTTGGPNKVLAPPLKGVTHIGVRFLQLTAIIPGSTATAI
jgi:hypothetical protein